MCCFLFYKKQSIRSLAKIGFAEGVASAFWNILRAPHFAKQNVELVKCSKMQTRAKYSNWLVVIVLQNTTQIKSREAVLLQIKKRSYKSKNKVQYKF